MFYKQVHTHVRTSPSGSTMQARFPFHAFTGFCFKVFFWYGFRCVFGVVFFALGHVQDVFGPQHGPLLGAKMAPKLSQSGLQNAWRGESESLQIPCVLKYGWCLGRVPRRVKIVLRAVLLTSSCRSIFISFLKPSWSSQKVTWSATWAPQEAPKGRSGVAKMRWKSYEKHYF